MATEKIYFTIAIALISFLILSIEVRNDQFQYSETSNNFLDTNVNITEAIEIALGIAEGEVTKVERKFKKNIPIWKIDLITLTGGALEIEISYKEKRLIRLDASEGPFNYDVNVNPGLIPFSEAKKSAEDFAAQTTLKWNLYQNKENWEYNFWLFTKTGRAQVRVNAENGEVIIGRKKKK